MKLKYHIGKKMKNTTGCKFLDDAGIGASELYKGVDICMSCPNDDCIIKSLDDDWIERRNPPEIKEKLLVCSTCGAMETGTLIDGRLEKTTNWQQRGDKIYHKIDCGVSK